MFFTASKIFWAIAEPASFLVLLGMSGVLLGFTRFKRLARVLSAASILGFGVGLLTPAGVILLRPLEDRFPRPPADIPPPTGIIVLGGALDQVRSEARGQVTLTSDGSRLTAGVDLARRFPEAKLVFSGGSGSLLSEAPPEAAAARALWLALGVPPERISIEVKSRNTWENAVFTRDLLQPRPGETWLLVTSAWHMPRSVGIFRRAGFTVVPYPVAYRTLGDVRDWQWNASPLERLFMLDFGVREWIGLLAYRLTDKTDALFPAP